LARIAQSSSRTGEKYGAVTALRMFVTVATVGTTLDKESDDGIASAVACPK
jgi:hypothetical protein